VRIVAHVKRTRINGRTDGQKATKDIRGIKGIKKEKSSPCQRILRTTERYTTVEPIVERI